MAQPQPQPQRPSGGAHFGLNLPFVGFTGFTAGRGAPPPSGGTNWLPWVIGGGLLYYLSKHGYLPQLSVSASSGAGPAAAPTQPLARQNANLQTIPHPLR